MLRSQHGFTLIELMIVVAIVSIVAAVALPIYNGYIEQSRTGTLLANMSTMRVFQEDFRLRQNTYVGGTYDAAGPDASLAALGWDPESDDVEYVVVANGNVSYTITATDASGFSICREYPEGDPC